MDTILHGDVLAVLPTLPSGSVHSIITSPPYFGLRDYGTLGQIGLEQTPEVYVEKLVRVFREAWRVLRDDGVLWLNLGDSYYNYRPGKGQQLAKQTVSRTHQDLPAVVPRRGNKLKGLKEKDLIGIPWRVTFALQADGWFLRSDIIWNKPNPMPASVKDRCTVSHEYIFMLTKNQRYYFDMDAIKEKVREDDQRSRPFRDGGEQVLARDNGRVYTGVEARHKRSVWTVATQPYAGAHFATFPPELIEPMVLSGCPKGGVVLDPFMGSGTTALVARYHGRHYVGIELNAKYVRLAQDRLRLPLTPRLSEGENEWKDLPLFKLTP